MIKRSFIVVSIFISIMIFYETLSVFFVQDDFFLLSVSKAGSIKQFLEFFRPRNDVVWYRPLSSQVYFFIIYQFFKLKPFFYHLIQLLTLFLNGYLIYLLSIQLFNKTIPGLLALVIYLTNAIHGISLAWPATYSFQLGVTFLLLALIYYLKNQKIYSLVFYFFGLLSSEILVFTLPVLFFIEFIYKQKKIVHLLGFIILSLAMIIIRFFIFPSEISGDYQYSFGWSFISNLRFYFFRSFGLPMLIKSNITSITGQVLAINFIIILIIGFLIPLILFHRQIIRNVKALLLIIIIYFAFLIPFLLMGNHQAPYYMSYSLVGFSLFLGYCLSLFQEHDPDVTSGATLSIDPAEGGTQSGTKNLRPRKVVGFLFFKKKISVIIFCFFICYISTQFISFKLTYNTHWLFRRAKLAESLVAKGIYQADVGSEEYFSLGANSAYLIYKEKHD